MNRATDLFIFWYTTSVEWMDYLGKGELLTNILIIYLFECQQIGHSNLKVKSLDLSVQLVKNGREITKVSHFCWMCVRWVTH